MAALAAPVSLGAFPKSTLGARRAGARRARVSPRVRAAVETAVSYTHLTLPTILLV